MRWISGIMLTILLVGLNLAQEKSATELSKKPMYERLLKGEDLKKVLKLVDEVNGYEKAEDWTKAKKAAQAWLDFAVEKQGSDHWQIADIKVWVDWVDIQARLTPEERKQIEKAGQQADQVVVLYQLGQFQKAAELGEQVLATRQKLLGKNHTFCATSLNDLAVMYQSTEKYAQAEMLHIQARDLRKKLLGENHPEYATSLDNLGNLYQTTGEYTKAEPLQLQARELRRKLLGEGHPQYAASLYNLGNLYQLMGQYAKAEPILLQARDLLKLKGEDHEDYAASLNSLAVLYDSMGQYAKAETIHLQALNLLRKVQGENHPDYAQSLNNLATLYYAIGEFAKAEPLFVQARDIRKKRLGENHPDYAQSLLNLAELYRTMKAYDKAEPLSLQARDLYKKLLGGNHPNYAASLNNLAALYDSMQQHEKAVTLYLEARDLRKKRLGEYHPHYAQSLHNLAAKYKALGEYTKAEPLCLEARERMNKVMGENHPLYAASLMNLATLYQAKSEYAKAEMVLLECTRSYEMSRLIRATGFQRAIGGEVSNPYSFLATVAARNQKPQPAYEALERNLARSLLDVQAERRGQQKTEKQQVLQARIVADLAPVDKRLAALFNRPKLSDDENRELAEKIELRRKLNLELADLAAELSRQEVADFASIQKAIPDGHALLTWVDSYTADMRVQEHWACLVKSSGAPIWVQLPGFGPTKEQVSKDLGLTEELRQALASDAPNFGLIRDLFAKVQAQRITPVAKHLEGVHTLYVTPVTDMAGIPIEPMLPDRTITYVPSGTFLARRSQPQKTPNNVLALGDPVFDSPSERTAPSALPPNGLLIQQVVPNSAASKASLKAGDVLVSYAGSKLRKLAELAPLVEANAQQKEVTIEVWTEADDKVVARVMASGRLGVLLDKEPAREAITAKRMNDAAIAKLNRGKQWVELPGTSQEVAGLQKLFGTEGSVYFTRSNASEPALDALRKKDELKKFKYLHIATHGQANNTVAFNSKLILSQDHPKVNVVVAGEPLLDNELTAGEVLEHWKLNATLVTLSACETGLGRQASGDGLLGFAQAFLIAGSQSVCLSLWKVDDTATALLMDRFYHNLVVKKMAKAAALHEAKQWLKNLSMAEATQVTATMLSGVARGSRGEIAIGKRLKKDAKPDEKPFAHPHYWSAFVLIGSPD